MGDKKSHKTEQRESQNHKENLSAMALFAFSPKIQYMADMLANGMFPCCTYVRFCFNAEKIRFMQPLSVLPEVSVRVA